MRSVEASIRISATPERVLEAFLQIEHLKSWWGVDRCLIEPRAGGVWACAWERSNAGFMYAVTGLIGRYEPGKSLRIERMIYFNPEHPILGPLNLTITVGLLSGLTEISVLQEGYGRGTDWDWYYKAVVENWPAALKLLKEHLEHQQ